METEFINPQEKEYIKLYKNSRGYNWEIKFFKKDDETDDDYLARLFQLNEKCKCSYNEGTDE